MPFDPSGTFTLVQDIGTGTPPDNQFPPIVGADLEDIASAMSASGTNNPYLVKANNLSDLTNTTTARANLGVSTVGHTGNYSDIIGAPVVLISSNSVSGGNIDIFGLSNAYSKYRFELTNFVPVTGGGICFLRVSTDGSTFIATNYSDTGIITTSGGASGVEGYGGGTNIALTSSTANWSTDSTFALCGHVELFTPSDTTTKKAIMHEVRYFDAGLVTVNYKTGSGVWTNATTAIVGVRFTGSAASGLSTGTVKVWGYV